MTMLTIQERLAGGVWGHLVGDAMGLPYEFSCPESIASVEWGHRGTHNQPPGTWSDDGALMLALLDSLLSAGFDLEDQGRRFVRWRREGAYTPSGVFDVGGATGEAISRIASGSPAADAGGTDEWANGNGSLMRILPLAVVGRDEDDGILFDQASASSAITHAHPRSRVTCCLYTLLARNLLRGEPDRPKALAAARSSIERHLPAGWRQDFALLVGWQQRSGDGYVIDCFWSAWEAFADANSYAETIDRAVRYGRDTDTTACVAGALTGVYWGVDAVPTEWRSSMRGQDIADPLLQRLRPTG